MKRCCFRLLLAWVILGHAPLYGQEKIPLDKPSQVYTIPWDADWVTAVTFVGDTRRLAAGNNLGQILIFDIPASPSPPEVRCPRRPGAFELVLLRTQFPLNESLLLWRIETWVKLSPT